MARWPSCCRRPATTSPNHPADEARAILDAAYGPPFPGIVYGPARPYWDDNVICCMSLSKLGLPGARTGIVIARPELIRALVGVNAIANLTTASLGPALTHAMIADGEVLLVMDMIRKAGMTRVALVTVPLEVAEGA